MKKALKHHPGSLDNNKPKATKVTSVRNPTPLDEYFYIYFDQDPSIYAPNGKIILQQGHQICTISGLQSDDGNCLYGPNTTNFVLNNEAVYVRLFANQDDALPDSEIWAFGGTIPTAQVLWIDYLGFEKIQTISIHFNQDVSSYGNGLENSWVIVACNPTESLFSVLGPLAAEGNSLDASEWKTPEGESGLNWDDISNQETLKVKIANAQLINEAVATFSEVEAVLFGNPHDPFFDDNKPKATRVTTRIKTELEKSLVVQFNIDPSDYVGGKIVLEQGGNSCTLLGLEEDEELDNTLISNSYSPSNFNLLNEAAKVKLYAHPDDSEPVSEIQAIGGNLPEVQEIRIFRDSENNTFTVWTDFSQNMGSYAGDDQWEIVVSLPEGAPAIGLFSLTHYIPQYNTLRSTDWRAVSDSILDWDTLENDTILTANLVNIQLPDVVVATPEEVDAKVNPETEALFDGTNPK